MNPIAKLLLYRKVYTLSFEGPNGEDVSYWCSSRKARSILYDRLLMLDFGEQFGWWASLHGKTACKAAWKEYLSTVDPIDDYMFGGFITKRNNPLLKECLITEKSLKED